MKDAAAPSRLGPSSAPQEWWFEGTDSPADGTAAASPSLSIPGPGWPSQQTVEYLTKLIILVLLLIALPHLLGHVTTSKGAPAAIGAPAGA